MLGVLGIGKMGSLIVNGIVEKGVYSKKDLLLCTRHIEQKLALEKEGYKVTMDLNTLLLKTDMLIIAIKPQNFIEIIPYVSKIDFTNKCVISIMASISIDYLKSYFKGASIYRSMPNIAMEYSMSNTTIAFDDINYINEVKKIFDALGKTYLVKEVEMNYLTPLNGSMTAFLGIFVKDFIDNAKKSGLGYEFIKDITLDSVISAAELLKRSSKPIEELVKDVCSKGGITIAGVTELYKNGFDDAIKACYEAATYREKELRK